MTGINFRCLVLLTNDVVNLVAGIPIRGYPGDTFLNFLFEHVHNCEIINGAKL